jgi:hypothetical protein
MLRPVSSSECELRSCETFSNPDPLVVPSFYHGCSTFLPVFDSNVDTYDALHERSPFAVDCICMVAARVRDGGGMAIRLPIALIIDGNERRKSK